MASTGDPGDREDVPEKEDGVGEGDEAGEGEEVSEEEARFLEDDPDDRSPPAPDDGPLRTLPVRRLPLATEPGRSAPRQRAWHWVPLGALVTLGTTTLAMFVAAMAVPETEESVRAFSEAMAGVQDDSGRVAAIDALMAGPMGDSLERVLVAMVIAFCSGVALAGFLATALGSAGILEAGLGAATFVVLSLVFVGAGVSLLALPSAALALGMGAAGGWVGARTRRWYASRRRT